tara:strand:+ start:685 stop:843 length:159 start_codon:yes stop_codon:yes gene_type:complete
MVGNIGNLFIMNLVLRAHENINDVTWSIIWTMVLLLIGVSYVIYLILNYDNE